MSHIPSGKGISIGAACACILLACALLLVACYGAHDNSSTAPTVSYRISAAANNVSGPVGSEISAPIGVFVGNEVNFEQHGIRVDFSVVEGSATLNPTTTVTDTSGIAYTKVTPLYAPGEIKVKAKIFATSIEFILTAHGT